MYKLSVHESYSHVFKVSRFLLKPSNCLSLSTRPAQLSLSLWKEGRQVQLHLLFAIFILHSHLPPPSLCPCLCKYCPALHFCASIGLPEKSRALHLGQLNKLPNLKVKCLWRSGRIRNALQRHKQGLILF